MTRKRPRQTTDDDAGEQAGGFMPPRGDEQAMTEPTTADQAAKPAEVFPKLDTVCDAGLLPRYYALTLGGEEPTEQDIAAATAMGRAGMIAAIREAGAPLIGMYLPGRTICPSCAGFLRVASSPAGPIRYHAKCYECQTSVYTQKLTGVRKPIRRPQRAGGRTDRG